MNTIQILLLPFFITFLVTVAVTPISIKLIKKLGLIDDPTVHKHPGIIHKKPIPRGGGIPLFIGCFIGSLFFLPINQQTLAVFFASLFVLVVGLLDDKMNAKGKDISPYFRFFAHIVAASIVVASGISIAFVTNPFGGVIHLDTIFLSPFPIPLSAVLSVFWLVWIMNMLNWSKGIDGQMPGIVAISAITIGLLSLRLSNPESLFIDAKLAFIIAGSAIGFLLFNFYPARIFPGFGATFLYLLLGITAILSSAKLATAILVMGVPLVDFVFTIIRRLVNKKSPFKGDRKHLHHLLFLHTVSKKSNEKIIF